MGTAGSRKAVALDRGSEVVAPSCPRACVLLTLLFAILDGFAVPADLEGVVRDERGRLLSGVSVSVTGQTIRTRTDADGGFQIRDAVRPLRLEIASFGYLPARVEVSPEQTGMLEIVLTTAPRLREEIVVTERSVDVGRTPPGAAVAAVSVRGAENPPSSVAELSTAVPGVALNGQGGRSQGPSIRGISRHRILTSLAGVRITGERRAGVSADFLDPFLIERIGVIRGPSSGYRGSGALGGAIEIVPREFSTWQLHSEFRSQGRETALAGGWGNETWSVGLAGRGSGNARRPSGIPVNDHFRSFSGLLETHWLRGDRSYRFSLVSSLGTDIGKAANDYPEKETTYPLERHLLARFATESVSGWSYAAGLHAQSLHTESREAGTVGDVYTDSWDLDMRAFRTVELGSRWVGEIGLDYFGRRSVDSRERAESGGALLRALDDGLEDNLGLFGSMGRDFLWVRLEGGVRLSLLRQKNAGYDSVTGSSGDGFIGAVVPIAGGIDANVAAGTGLRYPSLSERFYAGLTGRGRIIGQPSLDRERSRGIEGGLMWSGPRFFVSSRIFSTRIRDYIERIELEPDLYSYANLTRGTIRGLEVEAVGEPTDGWLISVRGHTITGHASDSGVLADVPVDRLTLGISHRERRWQSGILSQLRSPKRDPGSGEQPIPGVVLITPFARLISEGGFELSVSVTNLLNRKYLETADRKTDYAPGRSFVVGLSWVPAE